MLSGSSASRTSEDVVLAGTGTVVFDVFSPETSALAGGLPPRAEFDSSRSESAITLETLASIRASAREVFFVPGAQASETMLAASTFSSSRSSKSLKFAERIFTFLFSFSSFSSSESRLSRTTKPGLAGEGAFMGLLNSMYAARVCRLPYTTLRVVGPIAVRVLRAL